MADREKYLAVLKSLNMLPAFNVKYPFKARVLFYMLNIRGENYIMLRKTQHSHVYFELHLLIDASANMNIENKVSVAIPEGGAILLAPGTNHSWEDADDLNLHLSIVFVIDDKSQNPFDPPDGYLIIEKNDVFDFFSRYIAEMDYGNEEKARSLISYSFTFLMEEISKRAANGQSAAVTDIPKHNYVERAKRYILNHLKERPTVAKVAENVYISSKQLNRLFKQKENISVGEYIDRVICIEAKRMLINKELNIAVIANNLGFSSVCTFSNYIKYHLGVTPSEIRDNTDLNETISSLSEEYK